MGLRKLLAASRNHMFQEGSILKGNFCSYQYQEIQQENENHPRRGMGEPRPMSCSGCTPVPRFLTCIPGLSLPRLHAHCRKQVGDHM